MPGHDIALINASDRSCPSTTPVFRNTPLFVPNFNPSLIGQSLLFSHSLRKLFGSFQLSGKRELERKVCPRVSRENSSSPVIVQPLERVRGWCIGIERKKQPICFIIEKIVELIDRTNRSLVLKGFSRDLKYSFNFSFFRSKGEEETRGHSFVILYPGSHRIFFVSSRLNFPPTRRQ